MKRIRISTLLWLIAVLAISFAVFLDYRRAERLEAEYLARAPQLMNWRVKPILEKASKARTAETRRESVRQFLAALEGGDPDKQMVALRPFQGEWRLVSLRTDEGERAMIDTSIRERLLIIKGMDCKERLIFADSNKEPAETVFFMNVDRDHTPIRVIRASPEPDQLFLKGLARIDGHRLVFCWDFRGRRPADFEPGKDKQLSVYERVKQ